MNNLETLFNPKSIAVVGASKDPQKLGYTLLKNIIDYKFKGKIYPINPKVDEILGKKVYPKISALPSPVDLALLSIPSHLVLEIVEECARFGVKSLVILSSGFGETMGEGEKAQAQIHTISRNTGMRVLGPNCMGIYNISGNLNATYFWELPRVQGNISFISQSGAYGGIFFNEIRQRQIGISKFVSIGNMVDINHTDLLKYLSIDKNTKVIAMFIEGIQNGEEFMKVASEVSKVKPIVAFKAGRTSVGKRAAKSHTGVMAGDFEVYEALFKQSGVIFAHNTEEFFDIAMALSSWSKLLPKDNKLAILTISGGPSVIASDICEEIGLCVPKFSYKKRAQIRKYIPFFGADSNPVDMTPQMNPKNYEACCDIVFSQKNISGVIAINVGLDKEEFANAFIKASKKYNKPVVSFTIDTPKLSKIFYNNNIPIYPTPERSVYAYNGLVKYKRYSKKRIPQVSKVPSSVLRRFIQQRKKTLTESESMKILQEYGIPVVPHKVVKNIEEALRYAKYPVVLKVHSPYVIHKSKTGGLFVNLKDESDLKNAYQKLVKKFGASSEFLVQKFIKGGQEIIIGGKRDPNFGPIILFGMGGVFTEVLHDISLRICPINRREALNMIQETKGASILKDTKIIVEVLLKVSLLLYSNQEVKELDINPLIVTKKGPVAVDALIIL